MDIFKQFWLKKSVAERKAFAASISQSYNYLNMYAFGMKKIIGIEVAAKIHKATRGRINKKILRPDIDWSLFRA